MADYASDYINKSPDPVSSQELLLFIENDGNLYQGQYTSIIKNLVAKKSRGIYDRALAAKLFGYLAESGAKRYDEEVGGASRFKGKIPSYFPKKVRDAVAEELRDRFEEEYDLGNYDQYIPKKYQATGKPKPKSRRRSSGSTPTSLRGMRG